MVGVLSLPGFKVYGDSAVAERKVSRFARHVRGCQPYLGGFLYGMDC